MSLLDKANLLITPNAFKAGKLYSVIPANGSGDCTVVRNTTATRVNSVGLVVDAPANVARINYTLNTGGEGFILDEPQRTNLVPFSNDFTKWTNQQFWTANNATSPNGTTNASTLTFTGADLLTIRFVTLANGTICSGSIFVKGILNQTIIFNAGGVDQIHTFTGNWQILKTENKTSTQNFILFSSYSGVTARVFQTFGAQLEPGATASSYIPSGSAATTRNADVITLAPPAGTVKITTTFSNNTTQVITTIPATFTVPEGLIKQVLMQKTL